MTEKLKQLQKEEVLKRLEILHSKYGLPEYVVREFSESGTIFYSEYEYHKMQWTIHKISKDKDFETVIKEYEINNNVFVYYAIFEPPTHRGLELSMLYVSEDKWNWENEKEDLLEGDPLVYYKNFDYENESGFFCYNMKAISFTAPIII